MTDSTVVKLQSVVDRVQAEAVHLRPPSYWMVDLIMTVVVQRQET